MAGERLAKMISDAKTPDSALTDIIYGEVINTNPLIIQIDGSGFELTQEFIMLSQLVQDMTRSYIDTNQNGQPITRTLQIFAPLETGQRVRMIKAHKSQLYYVLDRF